MNTPNVFGTPSVRTGSTYTHREVLMNPDNASYMPVNAVIDASNSRDPDNTSYITTLRPGLILAKIAATGLYAPAILGTVATSYTSGTTLDVEVQCAVEIARRYTSGTQNFYVVANEDDDSAQEEGLCPAELVTYSAVNQSNGNLTVSALTYDYPVGSLVIAADAVHSFNYAGGIEQLTNLQILLDEVKVTDDNGTDVDVFLRRVLAGGLINTGRLINYPTEPKCQRWLKRQLNDGHSLTFSDNI